ncbi:MAG: cell division protein FtsQ/DivIB [Candidatus Thioglobus sp.]|nr:cell division protein FtsQ/DivIB [Candidatus Thioglobus sp.]|tara:strand:- start:1228 stop:1962 length:735 start_codon:yes stop_codon:yes gene_type:complete
MPKERINRPKQQKKPLKSVLKKVYKVSLYLLLALSILFVIYLIDRSKLLKPHISWEIDGELTTHAYQYDDLIKPLLNNKYLLNLGEIKSKVYENPWVLSVEAQRIFWNRIKVSIKKHDVAMRWGAQGYISSQGVLFKPNLTINSNAPIGLVSETTVKDFYDDFVQYQSILEPVKISTFERSSIDELTLDNNIKVILGHQKQIERLEMFVKSFEELKNKKYKKKITTRGIFDMRYPNGFALSYSP